MPDVASDPPAETLTAWLYQPFCSAGREGIRLIVGAVASYLKAIESLVVFPALSVQVPADEAAAESGPL